MFFCWVSVFFCFCGHFLVFPEGFLGLLLFPCRLRVESGSGLFLGVLVVLRISFCFGLGFLKSRVVQESFFLLVPRVVF